MALSSFGHQILFDIRIFVLKVLKFFSGAAKQWNYCSWKYLTYSSSEGDCFLRGNSKERVLLSKFYLKKENLISVTILTPKKLLIGVLLCPITKYIRFFSFSYFQKRTSFSCEENRKIYFDFLWRKNYNSNN